MSTACGNVTVCVAAVGGEWQILKKLKMEPPCDPTTLLQDIHPKQMKSRDMNPSPTDSWVNCSIKQNGVFFHPENEGNSDPCYQMD